MHGQQKKLNPIEDFAYPASKVPNTVSVKNPWHRWTSIGNVDRYQANEPAERLQNAWKTPEKRWRRSLVLFVFLVCSGDEHFGSGVRCDGVEWSTPWLCHLRQLLLHVVAANATNATNAANPASNAEICERRDLQASMSPSNAKERRATPSLPNAENCDVT